MAVCVVVGLVVCFYEGDEVGEFLVCEVVECGHYVGEAFGEEFGWFGDGFDEVLVGVEVGAFGGACVEVFPSGSDDDVFADGVACGASEGGVECFAVGGVAFWEFDGFGGECGDVGGGGSGQDECAGAGSGGGGIERDGGSGGVWDFGASCDGDGCDE